MIEGFYIFIGAVIGGVSGYILNSIDHKQRVIDRKKTIANAILYEINSLNEKMQIISRIIIDSQKELCEKLDVQTLYFRLKGDIVVSSLSGYSFIEENNPFKVYHLDIFNLQKYMDIAALFNYYNHVREANTNLNFLLNNQREYYQNHEERIRANDQSTYNNILVQSGAVLHHFSQSQDILKESTIMQDLQKISNFNWYNE